MPTRTPARNATRASRPRASAAATAEPLEEEVLEDDLDIVDQDGASVTPVRRLPAPSRARTTSGRRQATRKPEPAEDEPETVEVPFSARGYDFVFTVPAEMDDWPLDVLVAFEEGKSGVAVRGMLGPDQWRELQMVKPRVSDLRALGDAIAKETGLGSPGE